MFWSCKVQIEHSSKFLNPECDDLIEKSPFFPLKFNSGICTLLWWEDNFPHWLSVDTQELCYLILVSPILMTQ